MANMMYGVVPVTDAIGGNRIVVGHSDRYDFAILDAGTGQEVGRIGRDVRVRAVTEDHKERVLDRLATSAEVIFGATFPVATRVFAGPPGGMLWVRRHMGVGDELAPPIGEMDDSVLRLYDLFWSDGGGYHGTVEVPDDFLLMAGSPGLVAGVHRDELDRESVRVLRVQMPRQWD